MIGELTDNTTNVDGSSGGNFTLNNTCEFWFKTELKYFSFKITFETGG